MARRPRQMLVGQLYHVLLRGNNGQKVFLDDEDRQACWQVLRDAARMNKATLHAWLFLNDSVRLLLTPQQTDSVARMMQVLGRQYVRLFNRRHRRSGTLWEGRFRSSLIESPGFGLVCQQYLECLPVIRGWVSHADEFYWSSARHHVGLSHDPGILPQPAYWALGNTPFERERAWRDALAIPELQRALDRAQGHLLHSDLARALDSGHPVASAPWLRRLELIHGQVLQYQAVGRPARKRGQAGHLAGMGHK
ncbi:MAG: transposase [Lautropia sp.]|nr:transposase [Lautropia sp.]